jgi:hypothetical protein
MVVETMEAVVAEADPVVVVVVVEEGNASILIFVS